MANQDSTRGVSKRAKQLAGAQNAYRERMRGAGYRRLQAWVPGEAFDTLQEICDRDNISQSEALAKLIALHYRMSQLEKEL